MCLLLHNPVCVHQHLSVSLSIRAYGGYGGYAAKCIPPEEAEAEIYTFRVKFDSWAQLTNSKGSVFA